MTELPDKSNVERPPDKVPVREWIRVEREPKFVAFDVTAHCGPHAGHVMLNTYENEHSYFMSPGEAIKLSEALREAAETTLAPAEWEDPPWKRPATG